MHGNTSWKWVLGMVVVCAVLRQPVPTFAQPAQPALSGVRVLVRTFDDTGAVGMRLQWRIIDGTIREATTDAQGVALLTDVPGNAVFLLGGVTQDGLPLFADSYPAEQGFRLVLIPGTVRDVLVRIDGEYLILDPDMVFSPNEIGEDPVPTPPAFGTPLPTNLTPLTLPTPVPDTQVLPAETILPTVTSEPVLPNPTSTPTTVVPGLVSAGAAWVVIGIVLVLGVGFLVWCVLVTRRRGNS